MTDILRKVFTPHEFKLEDSGAVTVAFAQLNVPDLDGDVTLPGAFPTKDVPMSDWGHTSWDGALPTGKGTISEQGDWGVFAGQFFMNTDQGRNAHATVKAMADLQEWSYGYNPVKYSFGEQDGKQVRFLETLDVFEVSPVLRGAGIGTHTLAIKSGAPGPDAPYAEHAAWIRDALKAFSDRTGDRAVWRSKEGRGLSAVNRDDLKAMLEALEGFTATADELRAFLDATDPAKAARLHRTEIEMAIGVARSLGVTV